MIADALCDQDVWDARPVNTEPVPATIANLRAFADRMTDEDTRAEMILQELLAGSREEWLPRLREHPEWRTAGVVRKLIAQVYTTVVAMPPDAVEIAALATAIAEELEPAQHPSDTVERLRGSASRAQAYNFFYTGQFKEAEAAIATSEMHFDACAINEYELARVGVVKALVLRPFERFSEGSKAAVASERMFERYGDFEKTVSARLADVQLLVSQGLYEEAERSLLQLERRMSDATDVGTHARVLGNIAHVYRRQGKVEPAIQYYDCAAALLEDAGARTETVRIRWNVAVMLAEAGKVADACARLGSLTRELGQLGMTVDAALASLDVAEFLLAQNRYEEVEAICHSTMRTFELAGLAYTTRALTALAYIQEAANQRRADRKLVRNVREYIRELPRQPHLLFALAPD
jgi:tetratricopeptide (TPR) repeat protein